MAEIFKNASLPDYFTVIDGRSREELATMAQNYESEKVILLNNRRIKFDAPFFSTVIFPAHGYKKFKTFQFVEALRRGEALYPTLAKDCFENDRGKARYFGEQVTLIVEQVCALLDEAAAQYRISKPRLTLRCAPTFNENLHFDVYDEDIETHHFRLFVNLDSAHRIWHTSWRLSDVLDRMKELPERILQEETPGGLIKRLNFHVFGGIDSVYEERGEPKHVAFFETGEIWFVDSRKVSHQIFYGRRAISSESVVEICNMVAPQNHYLTLAENRRREILGQPIREPH